ncbi:gamma-glutamyltransferase [Roseobacter sp. A03A-229]
MTYGTMGGEGQPQIQAAIFSRYAMFGQRLQEAVTRPRWLFGKTWGDDTASRKIEAEADLFEALRSTGHNVQEIPALSSLAGHPGAVARHIDRRTEAASDPWSGGWAYAD